MKLTRKALRPVITFVLLNTIIFDAYSVSISTRRLYLEPKRSITDIRVLNMEAQAQSCDVEIGDVNINNQGLIELSAESVNSAKPFIRLAPKRFNLAPKEHQMVKLIYRRKPGMEDGEYQGVVAIKCKDAITEGNTQEQVTIRPTLVHNVPVIVRTTYMPIQAEFTATKIAGDILEAEIQISGQRSLTGTLTLINSASNEIVTEQKNISIYAQQPKKSLALPLDVGNDVPLLLRFTEDPNFGGDLVIQKTIR